MKKFSRSRNIVGSLLLMLALPYVGQAAALSINQTCVYGNCSSPDSISSGSISGSTYNTVTLADGDKYGVSLTYTSSYINGSSVLVDPVVTYLGTTPVNHYEIITLNFFQNFFDSSVGTFNGTYTETIPFNLPNAGSADAQLGVDGQGLGVITAIGPGYTIATDSANLTGLNGNTLTYQYTFNFAFDIGTQPLATASSVPEPVETIPVALAIGISLLAFRRRRP